MLLPVIDIAQTLLVDSARFTGIFQPGPTTGAGHADRIQHAARRGEKKLSSGVIFHKINRTAAASAQGLFSLPPPLPPRTQRDDKQAYNGKPLSFQRPSPACCALA